MRVYLKELRNLAQKAQQDVADEIGVSRQYYALIEKGERKQSLSVDMLGKLAKCLNVPMTTVVDKESAYSRNPENGGN